MTPEHVFDLFARSGALLEGHFQLSSGCTAPATCSAHLCYSIPTAPLAAAVADRVRRWAPEVVVNRGGDDIGLGVPFETLAAVSWPTHPPESCPLCADGIAVTKPGSRPAGAGAE